MTGFFNTKELFFEKINKFDKSLARLSKKKKPENTQINKIRKEKGRGDILTNATEIKTIIRA